MDNSDATAYGQTKEGIIGPDFKWPPREFLMGIADVVQAHPPATDRTLSLWRVRIRAKEGQFWRFGIFVRRGVR